MGGTERRGGGPHPHLPPVYSRTQALSLMSAGFALPCAPGSSPALTHPETRAVTPGTCRPRGQNPWTIGAVPGSSPRRDVLEASMRVVLPVSALLSPPPSRLSALRTEAHACTLTPPHPGPPPSTAALSSSETARPPGGRLTDSRAGRSTDSARAGAGAAQQPAVHRGQRPVAPPGGWRTHCTPWEGALSVPRGRGLGAGGGGGAGAGGACLVWNKKLNQSRFAEGQSDQSGNKGESL